MDYDLFDSVAARITDTGILSTKIDTRLAQPSALTVRQQLGHSGGNIVEHDGRDDSAAHYTVSLGRVSLKLARDPLVGTGGLLWPAGQVLANHLTRGDHRAGEIFKDKTVLELGSGTGVVGLSIAASTDLGSGRMILTDLDRVLPILHLNRTLNPCQTTVQVRALSWGSSVPTDLTHCDVILMADCVYLESLFPLLLDTLDQVMQKESAVAYLCYKKRRKADSRFFKMLRKKFHAQVMPVLDDDHDDDSAFIQSESVGQYRGRRDGIQLFKITRI